MPVYGHPLELHVQALVFMNIARVLGGKNKDLSGAEVAHKALQYIRTAIVQSSLLRGRRKRDDRHLAFSLTQWCQFRANTRYQRDEKCILALIRTLRRIQKNLPVTSKARASVVEFFNRLADECSSKGDSSSMTIGDSDD